MVYQDLINADTPSQVIAEKQADILKLSVVNPDLAIYKGQDTDQIYANGDQIEVSIYDRPRRFDLSQPVSTAITMKGKWTLDKPNTHVTTTV